ncbi:MAG: DUF4957 domain-containing protein [Prevotella sp.]|nr:DUF4957 domain-containing protein [Prevotella sp.]
MKKLQFMAWPKLCTAVLIGASALFMASCAQDGFDSGESFNGTITSGDPLVAPDASTFKVKSSSDRLTQTISWTAVAGALDYQVWVYKSDNVIDESNPGTLFVNDSIVHNPYVSLPRVKDTYYHIKVRSADNKAENNPGSPTVTDYVWNTFMLEITVPADEDQGGGDFYEYLKKNPIAKAIKDNGGKIVPLTYYFKANVDYKISNVVDLEGYNVTLASENESSKATIKMESTAVLKTYGTFSLQNLIMNYEDCAKPVITLSDAPSEAILNEKSYYIISEVSIMGCELKKVQHNLITSNGKQYLVETFRVQNSILNFDISSTGINAYLNMKNGCIKDVYIENSTLYNTGDNDCQYFMQYQNNTRPDRYGYPDATTSVNFNNSTFYNIADEQWANYSGFVGGGRDKYSIIVANNTIWMNCSKKKGTIKRILGQQKPTTFKKVELNYNTYWINGKTEANAGDYDVSGTILDSDPGFKDASGGDFTPTNEAHLKNKAGDPRWLPAE